MSISLNNIKKNSKAFRQKKRIGRGNSSDMGTYSGRGQKGQRARAGVGKDKLRRLGMKQSLLKIPKVRGFKSSKLKNQVVSVEDINKNFKDGETVNAQTLLDKNLINKKNLPIKILGKEKLKPKNLKFEKVLSSESVKKQIEK